MHIYRNYQKEQHTYIFEDRVRFLYAESRNIMINFGNEIEQADKCITRSHNKTRYCP